jgi:hypothetical protein
MTYLGGLPNFGGYLEKKGDIGLIRSWRRRYFCLRQDKLVYYKDERMRDAECVLGFIPLGEATEIKPSENVSFGFQVRNCSI